MELDDETFQAAISDFDGLAVVEFYAPWCRACRSVAPGYEKAVKKISAQYGPEDVRFFKVNVRISGRTPLGSRSIRGLRGLSAAGPSRHAPTFTHAHRSTLALQFKESKDLCLRQRVFALPAVHFYTGSLGRINRFTLKPTTVTKVIGSELDRYLGSSGHLQYLKSLGVSSASPLSPLRKFGSLVGLLQALVNADTYLEGSCTADANVLNEVLDGEGGGRLAELEELFQWIDANGDGVIDAEELAAVARAVGSTMEAEGGDVDDFYGTLLECATAMAADPCGEADGADEPKQTLVTTAGKTLDFSTFVLLMESREVAEFRTPTAELRAAFEALDANRDGSISRDEVVQAMESVVANLPEQDSASGKDWVKEVSVAFDVVDVNKNGSLDYEEFVAVLSGAAYTFGDER